MAHVCDLINGWGRRFAARSRIPEFSYFKDSAVIEQDPKTQSGGKRGKKGNQKRMSHNRWLTAGF